MASLGTTSAAPPTPLPSKLEALDMQDADIRLVLSSLAERIGLNIVVDPDVQGTVTVHLHDVTVLEAINVIAASHGYRVSREGTILRVSSLKVSR
jgi:type II secretory pathway component HofQ